MHTFRSVSLGVLVGLLGAAGAHAGTLSSATWITEIKGFTGPMVPIAVPVTAVGTSTATSVAVSLTVPAFSHSFSVAGAGVTLTLGGAQMLTATPSMAAATQGVPGSHITKAGALTFFKVPLSVGANGVLQGYNVFLGVLHYVTVDFYGWTPGTQTVTGLTTKLAPLPDVVAMGSFALSANGGGTITLVSPSKISAISSLTFKKTVSLTTLKLTFVPEPGTLLLLGAAALALLGIRRR